MRGADGTQPALPYGRLPPAAHEPQTPHRAAPTAFRSRVPGRATEMPTEVFMSTYPAQGNGGPASLVCKSEIKRAPKTPLRTHVVARPDLACYKAPMTFLTPTSCERSHAALQRRGGPAESAVRYRVTFLKLEIYPTPRPSAEGSGTCPHRRGATLGVQKGAEEGEVGGVGQRQRAPCQQPAGGEDSRTKSADGDKAVLSEESAGRHLQRST